MATLDEVIQTLSESDNTNTAVDVGAEFIIDSNMRVITVPYSGVVLGVEGDKDVNIVRFKIARFYEGNDLSEFSIRINYANANGGLDYYNAVNKVATDDTLTFEWVVGQYATTYNGTVRFIVRFIKVDAQGYVVKALNTTDASATVLSGIDVDSQVTPEQIRDLLYHLEYDIHQFSEARKVEISSLTASSKTEIGEATTSGKNELNAHVVTCKSAIDGYIDVKKDEIDAHVVTCKSVIDGYTDVKKSEIDTHTNNQKAAIQEKGEEVLASIPSDYTALVDQVNQQKLVLY